MPIASSPRIGAALHDGHDIQQPAGKAPPRSNKPTNQTNLTPNVVAPTVISIITIIITHSTDTILTRLPFVGAPPSTTSIPTRVVFSESYGKSR